MKNLIKTEGIFNSKDFKDYCTNDEYKLIFIHPPKTAGGSIIKVLNITRENRRFGHYDYNQLKNFLDPSKLQEYTKFTVTRNPWDRMVSLFHFRIMKGYDTILFPHGNYNFEDWLFNKVTRMRAGNLEWTPVIDCITDDSGNIMTDYIIRFENLEKEWKSFLSEVGVPHIPLPVVNKTEHKHYREYYTSDKSINFVKEIFQKDINYFNYKF